MTHGEIPFLVYLGMVAIGLRRRHAFTRVESEYTKAHAGLSRNALGQFADIEEAGAGSYPEFEQCHLRYPQLFCKVCAGQDGVGMLLPKHEIERNPGAESAKRGDAQRHQVEM